MASWQRGDRVMYSDEAWNSWQSKVSRKGRRAGTVRGLWRGGNGVDVVWDGRKSPDMCLSANLCALDETKLIAAPHKKSGRPLDLERVGLALYGFGWRSEMARSIGVASRTVRRWADGEWPAPQDARGKLLDQMRKRRGELNELIRALK